MSDYAVIGGDHFQLFIFLKTSCPEGLHSLGMSYYTNYNALQ